MRYKLTGIIIMIILMFIAACSSQEGSANYESSGDKAQNVDQEAGTTAEQSSSAADDAANEESETATDGANEPSSERMVIYTGRLAIHVPDYDEAQNQITDKIENTGGYIVESTTREIEDNRRSGHISARIPQAEFTNFMNHLDSKNVKIVEKSTQGEDVTEEYVDLESRLTSKEAVEERLLTFLDEAEDTEAALQVSNDLAQVQEEIEQIKGRMQYLENHSAYATVTVNIEERRINIPDIENEESLNTIERTQQLFMNTINALMQFGSYLVVFVAGMSPISIPLLIIGVIIWLRQRKKKQSSES
ncbi:uncharacterized lipoprotein YehR (DUF1307 family) [Alkalibacillus flavidus]|uniref:Uncharacterized lipoprotein YehR (DUF1307 family) n=1 Tax=Alkalibacillus flavidus TaxID=546021 RepID=A0ABV2KVF5_9BACI